MRRRRAARTPWPERRSMPSVAIPIGRPRAAVYAWYAMARSGETGGPQAMEVLFVQVLELDRFSVHHILGLSVCGLRHEGLDVLHDDLRRAEFQEDIAGQPKHGGIVQFADERKSKFGNKINRHDQVEDADDGNGLEEGADAPILHQGPNELDAHEEIANEAALRGKSD